MREKNGTVTVGGGGLGLGSILTIIFLVLKLCDVIAWPWICVFLPIIITGGIGLLLIILVIVTTIIINR